ncbi:methyl-accepting chemotaxis protein [Celeribacter neptunius]|uniref:Methyl-accepting chemotaxis sensory transducer with Pas/Pac sensor n=1 Tax=Celeribacter neptunius TaxID=588602 RepID=A0A1I3WF07_9RHOB|nr:PAS domain-containing methyl-accepting chemotaxis protein [Celeribacter neptunius]SFK06274.1 methyl-accepting chemotaxis sensory transducer with Pas/Pac sensor [Celeribacter neptunius]
MFSKLFKSRASADKRSPASPLEQVLEDTHLILTCDPEGKIVTVNDLFCEVTGYGSEEVLGKDYTFFIRPKDHAEARAHWGRILAGETRKGIVPRLNKAGEEFWFSATYSPFKDKEGKVTAIYIIGREISRMHLKRRDNRSKEDAIRRSMAFIEFDLDGQILHANDLFLKATGYTLEEIRGKHHRIFMPKDLAETQEYRDLWARLKKGSSEKGQVRRTAKNGDTIWLEATYETLIDPEGRPFKVVKYAFDITDAKNLEADARGQLDAIQKVQGVIEFAPDGTVLRANRNFCDILGYSEAEILGKHHRIFVDPALAQSREYADFWQRLRTGEALSDEYERIGKGGKRVSIRASYNPIKNAAGEVVKIVKFAVDTTVYRQTVDTLMTGLGALSGGDLSIQLNRNLGEFDAIRQSFNTTVLKLRDIVGGITDGALILKSESEAIEQATDDLARRTEHQAATLEESAAALDELLASVKGVADTATHVQAQSGEARSHTMQADEVVVRAISAMDEIESSSKQVASITSVIDDIAFQTNLLALNAGVEAARAGEAGRGFAVVASEVRALAQRSSDAAREIATLIDTSSQQVAGGVSLVREAGSALARIRDVAEHIHEGIAQVATSTTEQATGLAQLSSAMNQLDQTTQQNAAMSEETNAATVTLRGSITNMEHDLEFFSLEQGSASARAIESATAPTALARSA